MCVWFEMWWVVWKVLLMMDPMDEGKAWETVYHSGVTGVFIAMEVAVCMLLFSRCLLERIKIAFNW